MRLVSFPLLPTTPKTPRSVPGFHLGSSILLESVWGLSPAPCRDPAQWHQDISPGPSLVLRLLPFPALLTKLGDIRQRAVPRQARLLVPCCSCIPEHGWALGWTMALPGLLALHIWQCWDPAVERVGRCGAARGWTFSFPLSHTQVPVQEGPSLGLGYPVSPGMGTLLPWLPLEV